MARTRIGHKLIAQGAIRKDLIQSGSVEIDHLSFRDTATGKFLVDLADGDILALQDASNSTDTPMRGLKLGDLKSYISASSQAGGRTGSLQFASAVGGALQFGGVLTLTSDGTHITASGGSKLYFTNGVLNTSPKSTFIHASADKQLDIAATDTGSGKVVLQGGLKVQLKQGSNDGLAVGAISNVATLMDGRDNGDAAHRGNIRFNTNNSAPAVTIFSGSQAVFGTRGTDVQLQNSGGKLYFDNGTTYYVGSTSNVQFLTASQAKIDSLEVNELVSRTVTKNSLEIKDNLVIAAVSASKHGDTLGGGFQLGGTVGVEGTGSSGLFSITMGDDVGVKDGSMLLNVAGTRIVSIASGSFFPSVADGKPTTGMLAVTGAVSSSLAVAHNIVVNRTLSGTNATIHDLTIGGSAIGAFVNHHNIRSGSIVAGHLADDAVTTAKILDSNVTTAKINDDAVTTAKINDNAVTTAKILNSNVTTAKIADGAVTHAKLGAGAITRDNLGTGSITDKALSAQVVQNNSDAHGGIIWSSGKLSVGFRQKTFMQHGSTGSAFVTDGMDGPYTTASLNAFPQSGSVMVYLNGVLLAAEHFHGDGPQNSAETQADYRIHTASATNHQIHLNPDLSLDNDDILTVTFFSGSV